MVKLIRCLWLLTLLLGSNAYAWYCSYTPTTAGYISNLQCYDIDPKTAVQLYWCPYRNADPICRQFDQPIVPVCSDRTEVQTLSCPVHYSGVINQSRTYFCQSNTYSAWTTTSNNCTPDPPTCHTSTESRQVSCQEGYTGQITETRVSTCPDPYGNPVWGAWVESANTCVKSITNVTNVASPVSVISPVTTATPQVQTVQEAPIAPVQEVQVEVKVETKTEVSQSSPTVSSPQQQQEVKQDTPKSPDVPKGKELVPGFGIVMSLEIMNKPMEFQQQQLQTALDYSQELPDGIRGNQEFLTEIINQGSATNLFDISSKRWRDLYSNYEVQPDY